VHVELRLGLDFITLSAAYCRWREEGLFEKVFPRCPRWTLQEFLDWNYRPTVEPVGCYVGDELRGVGWICQARKVEGRIAAEVGAAFFHGTPISVSRQSLRLLVRHAFVDRGFNEIYGVSDSRNRGGHALTRAVGMQKVDALPWEDEAPEGMDVYALDREDWAEKERRVA